MIAQQPRASVPQAQAENRTSAPTNKPKLGPGGTEPMWNRNGRELFYRSGDKMMAVDVSTQPSFSVGKPRMLFRGNYMPSTGPNPNYDVSADGKRFLMIKASEQAQALTQINVVQNWFEELKQKVLPGKK